jgi:hypothetical protein
LSSSLFGSFLACSPVLAGASFLAWPPDGSAGFFSSALSFSSGFFSSGFFSSVLSGVLAGS